MAGLKSYPVLSRLRRSGVVYAPETENDTVELADKEAAPLVALKVIGEPVALTVDPPQGDGQDADKTGGGADTFDLVATLKALAAEGHDVGELNMDELLPLFGPDGKGTKRADVTAALAEIAKGDGGSSD